MDALDWKIVPAIVAAILLGIVFVVIVVVQARQYATFVKVLQQQLNGCVGREEARQEEVYRYREQIEKTHKALEDKILTEFLQYDKIAALRKQVAELEKENADLRAELAGRQLTRREDTGDSI